jgi:Domain of unknown function (DUF1918)
MRATPGDRLHMHGKIVGQTGEVCEVLEVKGEDGGPPYLVRHPDGHEGLVYPGPDTTVESPAPRT